MLLRRLLNSLFVFIVLDYIYISYYPETDKATGSVLNLVARLRGHGLNVIMDALCQREIDQVGMPRWYHSQLEAAKKIILVISKSYLKVKASCTE